MFEKADRIEAMLTNLQRDETELDEIHSELKTCSKLSKAHAALLRKRRRIKKHIQLYQMQYGMLKTELDYQSSPPPTPDTPGTLSTQAKSSDEKTRGRQYLTSVLLSLWIVLCYIFYLN